MRQMQFKGRYFAPASVLRQNQIDDLNERKRGCEVKLEAALRGVPDIDVGYTRDELNRIDDMLLKQTAKPFEKNELDGAIVEEKKIRQQLIEGIPSDKEMRHASSAAIAKHLRWEMANKPKIMYWKGLRMRLDKSGVDLGVDKTNIANLEVYRPQEHHTDTSYDDSIVPVKTYHPVSETKPDTVMIDTGGATVVATDGGTFVVGGDTNITLASPFFSLKKQVKDLTGTAPKNTVEAKSLLDEAGIKYME